MYTRKPYNFYENKKSHIKLLFFGVLYFLYLLLFIYCECTTNIFSHVCQYIASCLLSNCF